MAWYKIYAGLGGGFGGAIYQGTWMYDTLSEAENDAYRMAQEEYESYEGLHGLSSYNDCYREALDVLGEYESEADIEIYADELYLQEMESWISYYVKEATGPDDTEED